MSVIKKCKENNIIVFGVPDKTCRNSESLEMVTFFNKLRRDYPEIGAIAIHVRNEGKRTYGQSLLQKAEGMVPGAPDIIIPGGISFLCEMKSKSPSASISLLQIEYLKKARNQGAFVCVALGADAAIDAVKTWVDFQP